MRCGDDAHTPLTSPSHYRLRSAAWVAEATNTAQDMERSLWERRLAQQRLDEFYRPRVSVADLMEGVTNHPAHPAFTCLSLYRTFL